MTWIYYSLTKSVMSQIVGINATHEIWIALERNFSTVSKARIMQLRLQLQTAKKGRQSMLKYLFKIKKIVDNLSTIEEYVTEQDHILYILGGLGYEYNSFVMSITSHTDAPNLDDINSLMLAYESLLE